MSSATVRAGIPSGAYPERPSPNLGKLDEWAVNWTGRIARRFKRYKPQWDRLVALVEEHGPALEKMDEEGLQAVRAEVSLRLRREGFLEEPVALAFALVREVAGRILGMRHYPAQLIGGWVLLQEMVAEMDTGEGKTLTATLPVSTLGLAGVPVHLITANDYLAARDAEQMEPVYRALGLSIGVVVHGMDLNERREAYACDITYCTNKEVAFDYLKDRIVLEGSPSRAKLQVERLYGEDTRVSQLLLRGLYAAIVDEADSVLIDEARTPLIISGEGKADESDDVYRAYFEFAGRLEEGEDYTLDGRERSVHLTPAGYERLEEGLELLGDLWKGRGRSAEMIVQALTAVHFFQCDEHYLVKDDKVHIIDEYTGRLASDRHWERGLHQFIEVKEGCEISAQQGTRARISYQRFFRRYLRLSGMTGTGKEVAGEMWSVYGLHVVPVPPNRPKQRIALKEKVFATADEKWAGLVKRVKTFHEMGRPILIGTRSVAASEHLDRLLDEAGLPHQVLNARQDEGEAQVVSEAGQQGRITVATNMAGRGTDIRIAPEMLEIGGLHVIASERHDAGRIDRQLYGRCGRQGDPGSYELFVSLEDDILKTYASPVWKLAVPWIRNLNRSSLDVIGGMAVHRAQLSAERKHSKIRQSLLKMDEYLEGQLAFSGPLE